jgi:hypothetical protein
LNSAFGKVRIVRNLQKYSRLNAVNRAFALIYEVIGLVKAENSHTSPFRSWEAVKGALKAFILDP